MAKMRVALYARASKGEQIHSTPGQLREMREALADRELVAEIADEGEKRHTLERPGVDRLRELAETGAIDEVWTWEWSRFGEFPQPEVLALEMEEYGVTLRSLDDGGGGENSYEMNVIKSLFSRREQKTRVSRAQRGKRDKARRGEIDAGGRPRYGFNFLRNDKGKATGYVVDWEKMDVVRRIIRSVADGDGLYAVKKSLLQDGILSPGGKEKWSEKTIRDIVRSDIYKPHEVGEVEGVPEGHGVLWSGQKKSKFRDSRSKRRVTYPAPREEWIAVPVDLNGSGLEREAVLRARSRIQDNKMPSKVGDRFWELSGKVLRCAECGRCMHTYRRRSQSGGYYHHYYRCRKGAYLDEPCPNRKSHRAADLEERAREIVAGITSEDAQAQLWEAFRGVSQQLNGDSQRHRRAALSEALQKIDARKHGYWELAADGDITREIMRAKVS